jgi:leader peptidase (prepilin peptidase)/N-methyltransferase
MGFAIGTSWALAPFAWLVPVLVIAALVDLRTMLIPRRVVWGGFTVGAALIAAVSVASGHPERLLPAALGAGGYFLFLFILHLISPSSMGFGDVRLAVLLGLHLGWIDPILCFYALFLGCIVYLGYAVPHRIRLGREAGKFSPFGPALAASTIATVCLWSTLVKR